jgi:FXSXX-COOH protein
VNGPDGATGESARATELADVTRLPLMELRGLEDSALARAMRRIFDEMDRAQGSVAGWQSAI